MPEQRSHAAPIPVQFYCPLCRGEAADALVRAVLKAQPGEPMSAEIFKEWLRAVGTNS